MKRFIYGRAMGYIQLIFWIIMIPWIILTIPVQLFLSQTGIQIPWLNSIFNLSWVDWKYGLMVVSTLNMFLLCIAIIWMGWQMMHPISEHHTPTQNIDRLILVKQFSKKQFLKDIHQEAIEFQETRK